MEINYDDLKSGDRYYVADIYNHDIYYCECQEEKVYTVREVWINGKFTETERTLLTGCKHSIPIGNGFLKQSEKPLKNVHTSNVFATFEEAKAYYMEFCKFCIKNIECNTLPFCYKDEERHYNEYKSILEKLMSM